MPRLIQKTLTPLIEIKQIKGIDNVTEDDLRIPPGYVRSANNVDIDTELMARRRKGVLRALLSGRAHSGWSDEDRLCFVVLNDDLIQINPDWTTTTILQGVGPMKMSFVKVGDRVFFSNRRRVGYIKDSVAHGFPTNVRPLRQVMVGGELLEYFDSRLYAAQGGMILRSVAGNPFEMDLKRDFIMLGGPITMMLGVNGPGGPSGMYVSGGGKCAFLSNLDPSLAEASYKKLLDVPAIPGSAVKTSRMNIGKMTPQVGGESVVFSTKIGIYMGFPGGYVRDLTSKYYAVKDIQEGSSIIRWENGYRQYIFVGQAPAEIAGKEGSGRLTSLIGEGKAEITEIALLADDGITYLTNDDGAILIQ
jgi:hypothetical protein